MTQHDYPRPEDGEQPTERSSNVHTAEFVCEGERSLSVCVVEAVAETTGTDPLDLQPLYDVIDPDALETLFGTPHSLQRGRIAFRYEGCTVTIDTGGVIAVSPR